ncbi:protein FREE1 isoform X2 [Daucus carota subsp. sativus]|uniref:protein FREE1 isoform X2 n=1 Tax=Daucus carota subsp. sativus TaxID=79200 RepID=UPI0007F03A49|nr:PREDICTED: protein FREE1-like isoform X2 [Daucus carota subsp. sativus]
MNYNTDSNPYFQYDHQSYHLQNPNFIPHNQFTTTTTPAVGADSQASAPPISSDYSLDYSGYYDDSPVLQHTDHRFHQLTPNPDFSRNQNTEIFGNSVPPFLNEASSYYNDQMNGVYGGFGGDSGGNVEGYGGGSGVVFDDYGRPISAPKGDINVAKGNERNEVGSFGDIVRAVPKVEDVEKEVNDGVQKFRVKMLSEGGGQSDMDVLCQIGLDGIRILDSATNRILKIYQLETLTRWEVLDSYIFAFWVQSSIDNEPRRIRIKSNSYTTSNLLDTVAAASIQLKEMAESNKPSTSIKESDSDKKKGLADWMNLVKPGSEEKDHWVPDEAVTKCTNCRTDFGAFVRRHHCRNCGDVFCDKCTQGRIALTADESAQPVRVCDGCMAEVSQRMSNAKEVTAKVTGLRSHNDLAKQLQAMEKNRKPSTGVVMPIRSDTGMREVECPTCTFHLQVKVPTSGSKTIECYICRHPFLIGAP